MAAIGIDTHKATLAACAVDERGAAVAEREFSNDAAGHRALDVAGASRRLRWDASRRQLPARLVVVAGASDADVGPPFQILLRARWLAVVPLGVRHEQFGAAELQVSGR